MIIKPPKKVFACAIAGPNYSEVFEVNAEKAIADIISACELDRDTAILNLIDTSEDNPLDLRIKNVSYWVED